MRLNTWHFKLFQASNWKKQTKTIAQPKPMPCFVEDKYTLSVCSWYWPTISGLDAEQMLQDEPDGSFLVRRSSTAGFRFTLTYKVAGKVGNLRVQSKDGLFSLSFEDPLQPREPTLQSLVNKLSTLNDKNSFICGCLKRELINGTIASVPLKLNCPLKRDVSLQSHCRKTIMRLMSQPDKVRELNVPANLKEYLLELKDEV
eukprot:gene17478-19225_t